MEVITGSADRLYTLSTVGVHSPITQTLPLPVPSYLTLKLPHAHMSPAGPLLAFKMKPMIYRNNQEDMAIDQVRRVKRERKETKMMLWFYFILAQAKESHQV